ncbi:MAG: response regulator [Pseudodesulfovibrio sp.]|nr:response regulator [Pseudodesulfovibrio sp.]
MTPNKLNSHTTTHSLSRKAALVQMVIISAIVFCFSFAIIFFNTYRLNTQLENQIDAMARLAETSLESAVWQVDHASARDFIDAMLQDESVVFAQVVTGREIMASRTRPQYARHPFNSFKNNGSFLTKTVEIRKFGDWIGTFNLAITTKRIDQEIIINIAATLILALVLILAISQTTFYYARKNLFTPLKNLEDSAIAIADGDLDAFIDTSTPGEFSNLARAFDDMRESVRHLISDLQKANSKMLDHRNILEATVKERTEELKRKNISLNHALGEIHKSKKAADVANLAKSRFLASMSHEIRTPMNAILGMADILWETELTHDQKRYVQVFRTAGESLLEILNDILDLSKIEAGHLELEETRFYLSEIVDKSCAVIEPKIIQKQLEFSCSVAQDVPDQLIGDPTRLSQILINLLGNAVKFTAKGSISLTVERAPASHNEPTLQFSISDTGLGIPTGKLGSIFDSFTQADSSTTREYGGTGLGLAISKQLVQMMSGRIWAESSPGRGSTFHFTARLDTPRKLETVQSEDKISNQIQTDLPKANILMLEDSKYNAFVIQTYLKNTPCRLTVVENGAAGYEELKKGGWDLVIMDIQMPIMDGYETTRAIRNWEHSHDLPPIPIVAMTAYALVGDAEKCFEAGADRHLPKPVKKSTLFDVIRELIDTGKPQKEHKDTPTTTSDIPLDNTPSNTTFANVKDTILAAHTALDRNDYSSIKALAADIADSGTEMSMVDITKYGNALKNAADNKKNPNQIKQILTILTEYIDRFETV